MAAAALCSDNRTDSRDSYNYSALPSATSFRVAELLPGNTGDDVYFALHIVEWEDLPQYEAISYAWGDPTVKAPVFCEGRVIEVTRNLHAALSHFRYEDKSRFLWADTLW